MYFAGFSAASDGRIRPPGRPPVPGRPGWKEHPAAEPVDPAVAALAGHDQPDGLQVRHRHPRGLRPADQPAPFVGGEPHLKGFLAFERYFPFLDVAASFLGGGAFHMKAAVFADGPGHRLVEIVLERPGRSLGAVPPTGAMQRGLPVEPRPFGEHLDRLAEADPSIRMTKLNRSPPSPQTQHL